MKTIFFFFSFLSLTLILLMKMFHVLSFLIGVEMMGLYIIFLMSMSTFILDYSFLVLTFLSFSVCESVLGLVLFVVYSRYFSKDYLFSLNLLKF